MSIEKNARCETIQDIYYSDNKIQFNRDNVSENSIRLKRDVSLNSLTYKPAMRDTAKTHVFLSHI